MGTEGFKEARRRFFEQFPDFCTTIDHIVSEGDKVVALKGHSKVYVLLTL
jgi:predicted ester cyclase